MQTISSHEHSKFTPLLKEFGAMARILQKEIDWDVSVLKIRIWS